MIVENDEDQHKDEDITCHHARNDDVINSFGQVPIYMIRYNSDAFKVGGVAQTIANYEKMDILLDLMTRKLKDPPIHHQLEICYMFYNCKTCADSSSCSYCQLDRFTTHMDYIDYVKCLLEQPGKKRPGPSINAIHIS